MSNAGLWAGIAILVYASVVFWQSLTLDYFSRMGPGPGFFPRWLSGILFVLTLVYMWDAMKKNVLTLRDLLPTGRALGNMAAMLGGLVLFTLLLNYTGFIAAAVILLFIMFIRDFRWYYALGASAVIAILLYFVFQTLLGVSLPTNNFGW